MRATQLRNPWFIDPAVLLGNIALSMAHLYAIHEFTSWRQFPDVIDHASLGAFETTVGWFFLRSPWAGKITEIMGTMTTPGPEGPTVATLKVTTDEPKP